MPYGRPVQPPEIEEQPEPEIEREAEPLPAIEQTPTVRPRRFEVRRFREQERQARPLSR